MSQSIECRDISGDKSFVLPPSRLWTPGQMKWVLGRAGALAIFLLGLLLVQFKYTSILFTHQHGQRMLVMAVALAALGMAVEMALWLALNRFLPPWDQGKRIIRLGLTWSLGAMFFVLFYLPLVFVLIVGPATIRISETLLSVK
jgi:hypothetical protein